MHLSTPIETKVFRQQLRREETPCERMRWKYLKDRQMEGLKFRQQHGLGVYVTDFYCPEIRLCIEVDGSVHDGEDARRRTPSGPGFSTRTASVC